MVAYWAELMGRELVVLWAAYLVAQLAVMMGMPQVEPMVVWLVAGKVDVWAVAWAAL